MPLPKRLRVMCAAAALLIVPEHGYAQQSPTFTINENPPKAPSLIERLGPTTLRIGTVHVDTDKKEVSVGGVVTDANILEFVAVTKNGYKGYESALELNTNAINFNVALILIGLDQSRSVIPKRHMDPDIPKGDPVEIWVEWGDGNGRRKVRAEELIYNSQSKKTLSEGPWVYTGSVLVSEKNAYLADVEGSLIGFAHTPAPVIESPRPLGTYGNEQLNPNLNLKPGTPVTVTVRALPRPK